MLSVSESECECMYCKNILSYLYTYIIHIYEKRESYYILNIVHEEIKTKISALIKSVL